MGVTECSFPKCEMHDFVMKTVDHMKEMQETSLHSVHAQNVLVAKLTENLLELQRNNEKLQKVVEEIKEDNRRRDLRIEANSKFIYKAVGVIGSISFIAAMSPLIFAVIKIITQAEIQVTGP